MAHVAMSVLVGSSDCMMLTPAIDSVLFFAIGWVEHDVLNAQSLSPSTGVLYVVPHVEWREQCLCLILKLAHLLLV